MKKYNIIDVLLIGLTFTLAVSSLSYSIMLSLYMPVSFIYILSATIVFYMLFSIYFKSPKIFIILFVPTIFIMCLYLRRLYYEIWWDNIIKYIDWIIQYALANVEMESEFIYPSVWLITGILSLIYFFLIVKHQTIILPALIGIGIIGLEWYLNHTQIIPCIWGFASAFILMISTAHYRKLSKSIKLPSIGICQLSTLPIMAIIIFTSVLVLPSDTQMLKWNYLEKKIDKIVNTCEKWYEDKHSGQTFYLSNTGFASAQKLGGPIKISDDIVLEVTSPYPVYLRGRVLNEYVENGWLDTIGLGDYNIENNPDQFDRSFDMDELLNSYLSKNEQDTFLNTFDVNIVHTGIKTSTLFNISQTRDISFNSKKNSKINFSKKGETFCNGNIKKNQSYTIKAQIKKLENDELRNFIISHSRPINFSIPLDNVRNDMDKIIEIQKNYTTLPTNIPERVIKQSQEIVTECCCPFEMAEAIQNYLKSHYEYTLEPPFTPEGRDFVDYFLFDLKKGYCTYFATAMAVMGRTVGLPTRYVEGFITPPEQENENISIVKKRNAHAWVEVYFPNIGWIPFDPTPASQDGQNIPAYGPSHENMHTNMPITEAIEDQQDHTQIPNQNHRSTPKNKEPNDTISVFKKLIIITVCIFCIILGISIYRRKYWKRIDNAPYNIQLEIYYKKILKLLEIYNYPILKGETPYTYAKRIDTRIISKTCSMDDIACLVVKTKFGQYQPTNNDIKLISNFYTELAQNIKKIKYLSYLFTKFDINIPTH
ncbi:MAG: hypothetical protein ACFWUE_01540 [Xylanivirga thermophila]|uniref:transglutaminase-like domain-containing protein n=1 Tax=Xylanivirga thermophila TaxID=2496273 RepID=UPI0039F61E08